MSDGGESQLATRPVKTPVLADERGLRLESIDAMWRFAVMAVNSNVYKDLPSPEVAMIKIQAGAELGLTPVWSLTNILVVNGRPSVWGDALLGIVRARPECEDVIEISKGSFPNDDYAAVCEVRRKGCIPVIREFSVGDAKKAGIFGKNVHGLYPKRMLQMRARSWACRDAFADALRGLSVKEEQETVSEPNPIQARVVATGLQLPDEPEALKIEPTEQNGTNPKDYMKVEELFN